MRSRRQRSPKRSRMRASRAASGGGVVGRVEEALVALVALRTGRDGRALGGLRPLDAGRGGAAHHDPRDPEERRATHPAESNGKAVEGVRCPAYGDAQAGHAAAHVRLRGARGERGSDAQHDRAHDARQREGRRGHRRQRAAHVRPRRAARSTRAQLDLAWVSPIPFIALLRNESVVPLASPQRGGMHYHGAIVVAAELAHRRSLPALVGKRAAWVDRYSAAGFVVPRIELAKAGLDVKTAFASQHFYGSHAAVVQAVADGRADFGATYVRLAANDAVVGGPWLDDAELEKQAAHLRDVRRDPAGRHRRARGARRRRPRTRARGAARAHARRARPRSCSPRSSAPTRSSCRSPRATRRCARRPRPPCKRTCSTSRRSSSRRSSSTRSRSTRRSRSRRDVRDESGAQALARGVVAGKPTRQHRTDLEAVGEVKAKTTL